MIAYRSRMCAIFLKQLLFSLKKFEDENVDDELLVAMDDQIESVIDHWVRRRKFREVEGAKFRVRINESNTSGVTVYPVNRIAFAVVKAANKYVGKPIL